MYSIDDDALAAISAGGGEPELEAVGVSLIDLWDVTFTKA
jgi:hypothetical protein